MFEFSLAAVALIFVVGWMVSHLFIVQVLGYVSKTEATVKADWEKFKAELTAKHDLLAADLTGKNELNAQQLADVKTVQIAMVTAAPAVPVAVAQAPVTAPGTTQVTETATVTTVAKS